MEHDPEIALGNVERLTNFAIRPLLHGIELKHLRQARRQFSQRPFEIGAELAQFQSPAWRMAFGRDIVHPEH